MRKKASLSGAAEAVGLFCALWVSARFVNSFFHHRSEYGALHREARILVKGPCVTDAGHISGALIDCQHARRIINSGYYGGTMLYSTQHAARDVLIETVRGATHELGFLLQLCFLLVACLFAVHVLVRRWALGKADTARREWEKKARGFGSGYGTAASFYAAQSRAMSMPHRPALMELGVPSDDEDFSDDDEMARCFRPSVTVHPKLE
jgi:hypothetical protein